MIFHQIATERDRQSYLPGCPETCMAVVIDPDINLLDVRERDSYKASHIPGAILIPRGQLELRVDEFFPDPTTRIVFYCQ